MKLRTFHILFTLLLSVTSLHAEETGEDVARRIYQANINALMVFTSQDGLNTGHYRFSNIGIKMDIYHLPFLYQLDIGNDTFNMFIVGNVGYSRAYVNEELTLPHDVQLTYGNQLSTYTGGAGVGVRYKAPFGIDMLSGLELIYSRSGINAHDPDDIIGKGIEDFFSEKFNDNLTYKFFLQLEHHREINGYKLYAKLNHKLYETKADFNFASLTSFTTQASVSSLGAGIETPGLYSWHEMYLTFEGYIYGHYLHGDIIDVVGFDTYGTVGIVAYWYTEQKPNWAERFFLELSSVNSSGLEGYNVGIGFT
ncbi:MAG: hypothetical protein DSY80_10495, partial [Desulfocapsa sp.]